jgi:hypothetical protein
MAEAAESWENRLGAPSEAAQPDPWLRLGQSLFKHLPGQLTGGFGLWWLWAAAEGVSAASVGHQGVCVSVVLMSRAWTSRRPTRRSAARWLPLLACA